MAKYLVTGASGFVGRPLVERLLDDGHQVVAVGRREAWAREVTARARPGLTVIRGDLLDDGFIDRVWKEAAPFDGIFHYAAQIPAEIKGEPGEYDEARYTRNNVEATALLLGACRRHPPIPFVYASSISLFGRVDRLPIEEDHPPCPGDAYGLSKLQGEEWVRLFAAAGIVKGVSVRFPGMIGIGNDYGAVHLYTTLCMNRQTISVYGHGQPRKDYIAVGDVVEGSVRAMAKAGGFSWEIFNIGGCQPGVVPAPLVDLARIVSEAGGGAPVETNDRTPAAPVDMYFSNVKANRMLGYAPQPLSERVRDYVTQRISMARGETS